MEDARLSLPLSGASLGRALFGGSHRKTSQECRIYQQHELDREINKHKHYEIE